MGATEARTNGCGLGRQRAAAHEVALQARPRGVGDEARRVMRHGREEDRTTGNEVSAKTRALQAETGQGSEEKCPKRHSEEVNSPGWETW